MTNLRIETASQADAAVLEKLAREIWSQHYTGIISQAQIDYMLKNGQSASVIAREIGSGTVYDIAYWNGEPCGYSAALPQDNEVYLSKLYVKKACRGRGIARELVRRIEERAAQQGTKRLWLKCNKHNTGSLAAYQRLGFRVAYPFVTDIGNGFVMDDYVLEKSIGLL